MQQTDFLTFSAFIFALSQCDRDRETTLHPQLNAIAQLLPENPQEAAQQLIIFLRQDNTLYPIYKSYRNTFQFLYQANPQKTCIDPDIDAKPNPIPLPENFDLTPSHWQEIQQFYQTQNDDSSDNDSSDNNFLTRVKQIFHSPHPIEESQEEITKFKNNL